MKNIEVSDVVICKYNSLNLIVIGTIIKIEDDYIHLHGISNVMMVNCNRTVNNRNFSIYKIESYDFKGEEKELLKKYFELDIVEARKYKLKLLENL